MRLRRELPLDALLSRRAWKLLGDMERSDNGGEPLIAAN